MARSKQFRNFVFTVNNWDEDDIARLASLEASYYVYGKEVGKSGTPHLQGYCELGQRRAFTVLTAALGNKFHIEPRKGTARQAVDYCKKEGDFVEYGERSRQGERTDLVELADMIQNDYTISMLVNERVIDTPSKLRTSETLMKFFRAAPELASLCDVVLWVHRDRKDLYSTYAGKQVVR